MTSGASWNDHGLSPELYQAAQEAARRAGMSVDQWLNTTFGQSPARAASGPVSGRLDELSRRMGSSASADAAPGGNRLTETVSRLNARLEQLTADRPATAPAHTSAPPLAPMREPGVDDFIAEIAARQRALESAAIPAASPAQPQAAAATVGADFASLERQLSHITAQIETLRRPSGVEESVSALRADLSEIAGAIHEALPRRALEALQDDVHALAQRIDQSVGRGTDPSALENIENRLAQIDTALNQMTPAEGLGVFEARIAELSHKMDSFSGGTSSPDPETLRYLEAAINELRELSAGVASAEGVASIAGDVQALAARIDHLATISGASGLDSLAHRVHELTHALDTRVEQMGPMPQHLEGLVNALTDKLNKSDSLVHERAAFEQLESRIMALADHIETTGQRTTDLSGIERGIQQLTMHVREAREDAITTAERVARAVIAEAPRGGDQAVSAVRQDLEALHAHQAESDQRTQDTLEAVHETLERLVERLASVETGIKTAPPQAIAAAVAPSIAPELRAAEPRMPEPRMPEPPAPAPQAVEAPRALTPFSPGTRVERAPIDPDLPADTPLEPGTASQRARTPAERIAASEAALGPALGPLKREGEVAGKANFIAAARRAAQAAANETPAEAVRTEEPTEATPTSLIGRFLANRRRALVLGVSALLVLYGTMQLMQFMGGSEHSPRPASTQSKATVPGKVVSVPTTAAEPKLPSAEPLIAPTPTANLIAPVAAPPPVVTPVATPADVTGSVKSAAVPAARAPAPSAAATAPAPTPAPATAAAPAAAPASDNGASPDRLPAAISGALRTAAAAGNPAAEYEIGVRYSEGRGVPLNLELAAQWFDRAAAQGLTPAQYRLGSLYEKGQGVKKDLNKARTLYIQAADKGNAKATHNLAVLYAEGIDGKPDYGAAGQWFRKAALRGVADSQYNLGILYARGIGVEQNLAESYKWFALAAAQGDQDAGKKRDDVAAKLDQQSLVAAKLAVQTFSPDLAPDEATNVKAPAAGWDKAPAAAAPAKSAAPKRKPQQS
jgi:localization factor PodJL